MELDDAQLQQQQNQQQKLNQYLDMSYCVINNDLLVQLKSTQNAQRSPLDLCCVVDTSGSMGTAASNNKPGGEQDGLSILDIVKHAVKTIIHNLQESDKLSLVNYDNNATVVLGLTVMDKKGKDLAIQKTEGLQLGGCTNLWDGLHTGLETIKKGSQNKNSSVLLFTDGMPNVDPPRGYLPTLKKYFDENPVNCSINTFGFGYSLDSSLLNQLALAGNGTYAFIPDAGMVGTVFVNALSNLLVVAANRVTVSIELMNGTKLQEDIKGYNVQTAQWGAHIMVGTVQFEQTRDIVIPLDFSNHAQGTPFIYAKTSFSPIQQGVEPQSVSSEFSQKDNFSEVQIESVQTHAIRQQIVAVVRQSIEINNREEGVKNNENLQNMIEKSKEFQNKQNKFFQDMYLDLTGQIKEAFSRNDWYNKWGVHYLPSLLSAHLVQQQNNFKDPGVQHYGGQLFSKIRDDAESTFLKLPPPKPSIQNNNNYYGGSSNNNTKRKSVNMSSYHSRGAVCFAKGCKMTLADGSLKNVEKIQKGDKVLGGQTIQCILETICRDGLEELVTFDGGLKVTPYHPIQINNEWTFPLYHGNVVVEPCQTVYSFLLEERAQFEKFDNNKINSITVNGYKAATLAHKQVGDIIGHEFFGSEKVVKNLENMVGWQQGKITLKAGCVVKCPKTGLICQIRQNHIVSSKQQQQYENNQTLNIV